MHAWRQWGGEGPPPQKHGVGAMLQLELSNGILGLVSKMCQTGGPPNELDGVA
jgi:hypothetical protein